MFAYMYIRIKLCLIRINGLMTAGPDILLEDLLYKKVYHSNTSETKILKKEVIGYAGAI